MNGREYDDLSENFHFNGSNIDEEDEALFREKSTPGSTYVLYDASITENIT